jgi:hypothetical protein
VVGVFEREVEVCAGDAKNGKRGMRGIYIRSSLRFHMKANRLSGMNSSQPKAGDRIVDVRFDEDRLIVDFVDGRTLSVPLAWYPALLHGSVDHRAHWELSAGGYGIHWPDLDEDLSATGLLQGLPSARRRPLAA